MFSGKRFDAESLYEPLKKGPATSKTLAKRMGCSRGTCGALLRRAGASRWQGRIRWRAQSTSQHGYQRLYYLPEELP